MNFSLDYLLTKFGKINLDTKRENTIFAPNDIKGKV